MLRESGMLDNLDAPRMVEIPLLGNISCGPALLAEENVQAYVPIEANSLKSRNTKDYFFLKAEGDSMNNAGIIEGDLVLIRKQSAFPGTDFDAIEDTLEKIIANAHIKGIM